jgi:hypothetical protein
MRSVFLRTKSAISGQTGIRRAVLGNTFDTFVVPLFLGLASEFSEPASDAGNKNFGVFL